MEKLYDTTYEMKKQREGKRYGLKYLSKSVPISTSERISDIEIQIF